MTRAIKFSVLFAGIAFLLACQTPLTEKTYPAYTTAEAKTAYTAWGNALSSSMNVTGTGTSVSSTTTSTGGTATFKSTDGKVTVTLTYTGTSAASYTSMVYTINLNGFKDVSSGYTFSGTMTMTMSSSSSVKMVGDFDVSGTGPIQKMTFDISASSTSATTYTGYFKINGKDVDLTTMSN